MVAVSILTVVRVCVGVVDVVVIVGVVIIIVFT